MAATAGNCFATIFAYNSNGQLRLSALGLKLKRFPPDLNRRDSQRVKDERIFVH